MLSSSKAPLGTNTITSQKNKNVHQKLEGPEGKGLRDRGVTKGQRRHQRVENTLKTVGGK